MKIIPMNVDRAINRKFFEGASTLHVTSVFRTIQGEGPYAGYPAIFVRLAGCNFGDKKASGMCEFCDTNFKIAEARQVTPAELLVELINTPGYSSKDVLVVTGGEPTLQPLLLDFLQDARQHFRCVQVESNGTQAYFFTKLHQRGLHSSVHMVVSPKASGKTGMYPLLSPTLLGYPLLTLKYVLSADPSSPHHTVPQWVKESFPHNVYVSPMAVYLRSYAGEVSNAWDHTLIDAEATAENYSYAAQYAMQHNLLLSIQTHLFTAIP